MLNRANAAGHQMTAEQMNIAGSYYGLSDPATYAEALGGEPVDRSHERLVDVLRDPPPKSFGDFWKRDLETAQARLRSGENIRTPYAWSR